jgi:cytochrome c5
MTMSKQAHTEAYVPAYVAFVSASRQLPLLVALAVSAQFLAQDARAQGGERSGKDVVDAVCAACHGTGANGAPKIGDKHAWSKLAARGLSSLTQSALKGVRKMPAHGGSPTVSDLEIGRAISYMVNQSGGHWTEPISKKSPPADRSGEQIVQAQCVKCHQNGEGGAPKIGDRAAWIPRATQGLDAVVRSAIKGHGGMPARGGMADLTDAEMRKAIIYMLNQGTGAAK